MTGSHELLAMNGGQSVRTQPFPPRRLFGEEEKAAVVALMDQAIKSGHQVLGYNGPQEEGYCREFAESLGGGYADGVNSGTSAMYVALRALELPPFSEVIVPPITDPGGVMPVPLMNCIPVVADSAPGSYNVGAEQIAASLTEQTRAIVVAHIAGVPADMPAIVELARSREIPIVEDCAQAHGAICGGRPVGTFGEIAAFSTMFGKHHSTGGQGGLVFTRSEGLYWRIRRCADRGKPFGLDPAEGNVVASLNFNMDELHATIGRVQLRKLPGIVRRRRDMAAAIAEGCRGRLRAIRLLADPPGCESSYWFLLFRLDLERFRVPKATLVQALQKEGMPAEPSYLHVPAFATWWRRRAVYGDSGLPWAGTRRRDDGTATTCLPHIEATDACHFRVAFHEDWTAQEVADLVAALAKVEDAFLKP